MLTKNPKQFLIGSLQSRTDQTGTRASFLKESFGEAVWCKNHPSCPKPFLLAENLNYAVCKINSIKKSTRKSGLTKGKENSTFPLYSNEQLLSRVFSLLPVFPQLNALAVK